MYRHKEAPVYVHFINNIMTSGMDEKKLEQYVS